uniref:tRNA splicing endonuclease subunit 54 n=1 Tax=Anas platyrhynchos TaxID=8839 RepID=A0A8B9TAF1_ANAPL
MALVPAAPPGAAARSPPLPSPVPGAASRLAELPEARGRSGAPRYRGGPKEAAPDGSEEQAERLRLCRDEQWRWLAEERVEGNLVKAEWKPEKGIVELQSPAGKFWHTMGFSERGKQCLLPEEALYLLECGSVQLFYRNLPLSIQEAYEMLLTQEEMSLSHYQFCYPALLSASVVVSPCSTVPSPYERQLNLESHCKSSGKHERKRRRSSSPGDQSLCYSLFSPSCCGCPPQALQCSSSAPSERSSRAQFLLIQDKRTLRAPPGAGLETPRQAGTGTRAPRWDFTTIILPNVAPDQPCTHLPSPDCGLLPENVPGREVDAASWCKRINLKQEKLSRKEREQLERESRYKSSVNADREVRRCSNWQEYKALLKQRSQQRVWRRPPHLWDQAVTPLLRPEEATSTAAILQQISVLQPSHILDGASRLQEDSESLKISFNVYQPDAVAKFKKTNPGKPYVRMCVQSFEEQIPSLRALKQVTYQSGDVPVVFALVEYGDIAFHSLKEFKLPVDVNHSSY